MERKSDKLKATGIKWDEQRETYKNHAHWKSVVTALGFSKN